MVDGLVDRVFFIVLIIIYYGMCVNLLSLC